MFRLDAVSFSLAERTLLHPLSLDIPQGQMVGLIGHNGSGKSTLLKMLARQQPASSGRVLLDDKLLDDWKDRDFARQVAYLPQQLPDVGGRGVALRRAAVVGRADAAHHYRRHISLQLAAGFQIFHRQRVVGLAQHRRAVPQPGLHRLLPRGGVSLEVTGEETGYKTVYAVAALQKLTTSRNGCSLDILFQFQTSVPVRTAIVP